ncbi:S-layer homology domain-containing protein [Sporosarcina sp. ANT_H38]|uniref:S-layer homology domain-containing protein n=1 Tax=Sporosarcina sp. ANT_H38 TaxID=2597358 RepID=UPI0011F0BFEC|nr:S-layer homology domain-containing protein [Sporosarcina sp. ANT_H38]KAA0966900.1 S-layer homology domain-containing protein [Sporosarcina sp. ANT_H38]
MSSNQSVKYKKFVVAAASAALVASALAPVASAKEFTDTKGNTHEVAIDALSDAGVITGNLDGSFLPNKTLTRSDVVKLMGKWLVTQDYKVPTDYKTNMRFKDLTSSSNDELLQYAAIVKDNGVFNGSDGRLLAGDKITRENMAVVIVRAFDKVNDIDLVKYVAAQDFKKDVTDLGKAKAEARPAINVLDFFDITNPAAPAFNPKNTTSRGQFATFLYKTINADFSAIKAPKVDQVAVDAAAEQVKAGAVTVARGNYATDANKLAAVQAYVTSLVTEKDVVSTVVAGKTAGEYAVTLTKGEAKAEKTIAMTFDFAADDRFVTEVNALNATQVEVKFSTAVDKASLFTDGKSGAFKATVTLSSLDTVAAGTSTGKLSADGKTLTITTQNALSKRYDVVVDGLKSVTGAAFDKYESTITIAADKTAPTILGTEKVSASKVKVNFSEPMKAFTGVTFKYADGSAVTGVSGNIAAGAEEVEFTMTEDVNANKEIIATFIGAQDQAGNLMTPNPATVSFMKGAVDGVAPTVTSLTAINNKTVEVTFSEELASNPTLTGIDGTVTVSQDSTNKNKYIVKTNTAQSGLKNVTVTAGYKDLSGEIGAVYSKIVNFDVDTKEPKIVSNKVTTFEGVEYLELTFDEAVETSATLSTINVTGSKVSNFVTTPFTAVSVPVAKFVQNSSDKKVYRIALADLLGENDTKGAAYELTIKGQTASPATDVALVTDISGNLGPVSTKVNVTRNEDGTAVTTNKPVLDATVGTNGILVNADKTITVGFTVGAGQELDGASATNVNNYKFDGAVVKTAVLSPANAGKQVVTLTLQADSNQFTGERNVAISGVQLKNGLVMESFTTTEVLTENVAPTVTSAKLTDTNKVTLTFSEAVNTTAGTSDFALLIGGATVAANDAMTTATAETGVKTVVYTLETSVSAANITSGLSLKALSTLDIKDVAGNKLSVPANILVTQ